MTYTGTWRDTLVCHNEQLLVVPVTLPIHLAATLMVNPSTAYRMISDFVELKQGVVFCSCMCVCLSVYCVCLCACVCGCACMCKCLSQCASCVTECDIKILLHYSHYR